MHTVESLGAAETLQYGRQLILSEVGIAGQLALRKARVLVVGAGGLGAPVLMYLAAAGVGTLGIVEDDLIERSNLHRQVLFDAADVGQLKSEAALRRLQALNPFVRVETHAVRLAIDNALDLIGDYDIVVDATDNFAARYLISDACVLRGKPNVSASILRFEGQLSVFLPDAGPCYRCVFPEQPPAHLAPSCAEAGVLGVLPGIFGSLQATEVLKLILGIGQSLAGRLLVLDALSMQWKTFELARDPACTACSPHAAGRLSAVEHSCGLHTLAAGEPLSTADITPQEVHDRMDRGASTYLLDVRSAGEHEIARLALAHLIPLPELPDRLQQIPKDRTVVCFCHKGSRSQRAARLLREEGYAEVYSMQGGIDAWSRHIDPSIVRY